MAILTPLELIFPIDNGKDKKNIKTLAVWANGKNAEYLDGLSPKELEDLVRQKLKQIRPSTEGSVEISRIVSWGSDRYIDSREEISSQSDPNS